jgi:NOL1/NOP2/fmu family ribosome biogenesis protein
LSPSSSRGRGKNNFEPLSRSEVTDLWHSRFGMPAEAFLGYRFYRKANSIWVISEADLPNFSYEALGLRMISLKDRPWKPTTCALQIFGRYATKNVIHLNDEQAMAFLAGKSQDLETECKAPETEGKIQEIGCEPCEPGYVVVFYRGEVLGCGLYSRGRLASQLPKERRISNCMEGEDN